VRIGALMHFMRAGAVRSSLRLAAGAGPARLKGLRLVCAYGLGFALGETLDRAFDGGAGMSLGFLVGNFALWASVSEMQVHKARAVFGLVALCVAASCGALLFALASPELARLGRCGPELVLVCGAFLAGALKRFGAMGGGMGSQLYIGALLAYGDGLSGANLRMLAIAAAAAAVAAVLPRLLIGGRVATPTLAFVPTRSALTMGLQAALAALAVVLLDALLRLDEPQWAITACTYVITATAAATALRARQRIVGTLIGVPLALACLPLAEHWPPLAWMAAATAMIVYATALAERYDIACGAFTFTLIVTLAASGEHSLALLASRAWETLLGGGLGWLSGRYCLRLNAPLEDPSE
jgi:Fusaric acid resistance protein-like